MKILIGSRERLNFSAKKIFGNRIVLLVEPQFYEQYKTAHPDLEIVNIGENDKGIGFLYNKMAEYALSIGEKYYLCCDDDIYGLKKRNKSDIRKLENLEPDDVVKFLEEGEILMKTMDLAQLGISFQAHNWTYEPPLRFNTPIWALIFIDAEAIKKVGMYDEDIKVFNDYEMLARLALNGYQTASWYDYAFAHKMRIGKGGAEFLYAKREITDYACVKIAKKYEGFSKIVRKENHGLNEVQLNYKKLYAESIRKKRN